MHKEAISALEVSVWDIANGEETAQWDVRMHAGRSLSTDAAAKLEDEPKSLFVFNLEGKRYNAPLLIGLMEFFLRRYPKVVRTHAGHLHKPDASRDQPSSLQMHFESHESDLLDVPPTVDMLQHAVQAARSFEC